MIFYIDLPHVDYILYIAICFIFTARKLFPIDAAEEQITEAYCKTEYICIFCSHVGTIAAQIFIHVIVFIFPNSYSLPFDFYIIFMPLDGFSFSWPLSYFLMTVWNFFGLLFVVAYFPLPVMLMNNSCWLIDLTSLTAKRIGDSLKRYNDSNDTTHIDRIEKLFKLFVERCERIVKWQNEVQDLLLWNFVIEFQIQSIILCLLTFVLSLDFFGSLFILNILAICVMQLFVVCWMGTRIKSRVDQLSFDISKNWNLMRPKQRKDLQMVLHWTQNIKGFNGTFKDVDLNTFKSVNYLSCLNF